MQHGLGGNFTLKELQAERAAWAAVQFPDYTPEEQLIGAMEELGELCHAYYKGKRNIRGGEVKSAEADAVGDILVYLAGYCEVRGISMQDAMEYAWAQVKNRDWKANPTTGDSAGEVEAGRGPDNWKDM